MEGRKRYKRNNKILFRQDDSCLTQLKVRLDTLSRRQIILWSFAAVEPIVVQLKQRYPSDPRPVQAVEAAKKWSRGEITIRPARRAILAVHAMAGDITSCEDQALVHAVGQGVSCVHTPGHAMGLPIYHLSALVYREGIDRAGPAVEQAIDQYLMTIDEVIQQNLSAYSWADFLQNQ